MQKFFLASLFSLFFVSVFSQGSPNKIDMAYFYKKGNELQIDYTYLTNNELRVRYQYKDPLLLSVYFIAWNSPSSKKYSTNNLLTTACNEKDCVFSISMDTVNVEFYNTLIFRDESSQQEYVFPIHTQMQSNSPVIIADENLSWLPNRYLFTGTTITPQAVDHSAMVYVYVYEDDFKPAGPPTGLRKLKNPNIYPDSSFSVLSHTSFDLKKPGLYMMQTDTNSVNAYTFRVFDESYPDYKTVDQHVNAMQYLTTSNEWQKLNKGKATRDQFEKLWLDMAGTELTAKAGIRYYFRGIEQSNRLFTSFMDGWKTDKGMIYTIFGPPTKVHFDGFEEVWEYDKTENHGNIEFTFSLQPIIFSQYHSILHRDKVFSIPWNRTLDRLRRGTPNYE